MRILLFLFLLLFSSYSEATPNPMNLYYAKQHWPEGENKLFYKDGTLQGIFHILNGNLDGDFIAYHHNGIISEIHHFDNGTFIDTNRLFDPAGRITQEEVYSHDTLLYIMQQDFYDDGVMSHKSISSSILIHSSRVHF